MSTWPEVAADLIQRCRDAEEALHALEANDPTSHNGYRLGGKQEGVRLVRGYIEEALRVHGGVSLDSHEWLGMER